MANPVGVYDFASAMDSWEAYEEGAERGDAARSLGAACQEALEERTDEMRAVLGERIERVAYLAGIAQEMADEPLTVRVDELPGLKASIAVAEGNRLKLHGDVKNTLETYEQKVARVEGLVAHLDELGGLLKKAHISPYRGDIAAVGSAASNHAAGIKPPRSLPYDPGPPKTGRR